MVVNLFSGFQTFNSEQLNLKIKKEAIIHNILLRPMKGKQLWLIRMRAWTPNKSQFGPKAFPNNFRALLNTSEKGWADFSGPL